MNFPLKETVAAHIPSHSPFLAQTLRRCSEMHSDPATSPCCPSRNDTNTHTQTHELSVVQHVAWVVQPDRRPSANPRFYFQLLVNYKFGPFWGIHRGGYLTVDGVGVIGVTTWNVEIVLMFYIMSMKLNNGRCNNFETVNR